MDTKVNYTLVGIFVIALIAALTFGIIWLSSGFSLAQNKTYAIYMNESVSGLNVDAQVEYNGVSVGSIKKIVLSKNNPKLVRILIDVKSDTPITEGTVASLTTRGLTGLAFIALKDKSTNMRPLVAKRNQRYPVIPTAPSIFMRLDTALNNLTINMQKISNALNSLLDKENLESFKEILANTKEVTHALSDNSAKLTTILKNTADASVKIEPLLRSSTAAMKVLESQTLPMTYRFMSNLDQITRTLSEVATEVKQNPSVLVRGAAPRSPGPGERR
ncbi:MAG: MlaD family protein [Gammaproteobacteria bacterium]